MIFSRSLPALSLAVVVLMSSSFAGAADSPRRLDPYGEAVRQLNEARQRVRILEERVRQLEARRGHGSGTSEVAKAPAKECGTAFTLDEQGIKHLRAGCESNVSSASSADAPNAREAACSMPFAIDETGIKRLRPECSGD
jgi:hypothetical protein